MLDRRWVQILILCGWIVLGAVLRFAYLADKPLWTDEVATIVFSLGNSFQPVPLNEVLTADQLIEPLRMNPEAGAASVLDHLLGESNHPPLYYLLTHYWLRLFPTDDGLVSLWGVRSLAALFGVLSIPAVFGLSWLAFRSVLAAQFAAALMAVSPFGVYLAQEARHYTLGILWVTASLAGLILAVRSLYHGKPLSAWACAGWVLVNWLGIATHYFFVLTLIAEAAVLVGAGVDLLRLRKGLSYLLSGWRIGAVMAFTTVGGLVWIPFLRGVHDSELTQWLLHNGMGWRWKDPLLQSFAGWTTMLYLLPVQAPVRWIKFGSAIVMGILVIWTIPKLYRGLKRLHQSQGAIARDGVGILGGFVVASVLTFWLITYGFGRDLTVAFRYNFVFFPAVIVLVGGALAGIWETADRKVVFPASQIGDRLWRKLSQPNHRAVVLILVMAMVSAMTVLSNLGYQKTHRPDVVTAEIEGRMRRQRPVLVAIAFQTHGQTGRLISLAWDFLHHPELEQSPEQIPRFLLATQEYRDPTPAYNRVKQVLAETPEPLDLWLINFNAPPLSSRREVFAAENCEQRSRRFQVDGYKYQLYRCRRRNAA